MTGLSSAALDRLHQVLARVDAGRDVAEVLQAVADGITEVSGFTMAAVSVPHGRFDLEVVAVSGADRDLQALVGQRFPRTMMERNWARGESSGRFVFLPHEISDDGAQPGVLIPDFEPIDHPDAWHPLDELTAPLRNPAGELLCAIGVDLPADGKRPARDTRDLMEVFAMQASLGINQALERERLREELWLRGMVNELFSSTGHGSLQMTMEESLPTVAAEMAASDLWVEVFPDLDDASTAGNRTWGGDKAPTITAALAALGPALAEHARVTDQPVALTRSVLDEDHPVLTRERRRWLQRAFDMDGVSRLLLAPLPQGRDLNGQVVLFRQDGRPWSDVEQRIVLEVGRALGWAVQRDRSLQQVTRARAEVDRQREERGTMLRSLAMQVRDSMSLVDDHLRSEALPVAHPVRSAMEDFWTLFGRVTKMSGFLARPEHVAPRAVGVSQLLGAVWNRVQVQAEVAQVRLLPVADENAADASGIGRPVAWADADQLDWLLQVICEDIVRTTPAGGTVRLALTQRDQRVLVACQSSGVDDAADLPPVEPDRDDRSWWLLGAQALVSRMDGRLLFRDGPLGRRAVTLDLPTPVL